MPAEAVELETPGGPGFAPLIRLVVGGFADRADLRFDELDDLQLAVELLLAEARPEERVRLSLEIGDDAAVRLRVGPLSGRAMAEILQGPPPPPGEVNLRRVLDTVVDSFGIEGTRDGEVVVRLEKIVRPRER